LPGCLNVMFLKRSPSPRITTILRLFHRLGAMLRLVSRSSFNQPEQDSEHDQDLIQPGVND